MPPPTRISRSPSPNKHAGGAIPKRHSTGAVLTRVGSGHASHGSSSHSSIKEAAANTTSEQKTTSRHNNVSSSSSSGANASVKMWHCPACTYENSAASVVCEICSSHRKSITEANLGGVGPSPNIR